MGEIVAVAMLAASRLRRASTTHLPAELALRFCVCHRRPPRVDTLAVNEATMLNLLVVMIDCLRQDRFSGAGKTASTPNLDALYERSVSFENLHAVGSNTTAVMGSWFTGRYPFANGLRSFRDRKFAGDFTTMATVLRDNGYRTATTVTEAMGDATDLLEGFDEIERRDKKKEAIHDGYGARVQAKLGELNQSKQPWFYFVHTCELHPDRQCDPRFKNERYGRDFYDRSLSSIDHHLGPIFDTVDWATTAVVVFGDHGDNLIWEPRGEYASKVMNRLRGDGRISALWRLRDWFYRTGLYTGHKSLLRHNFLFHHDYHVYRFLTHSPMMLALPGVAPRRDHSLLSTVDMLPTLLDYLGVPVAVPVDGVSFAAVLRGETAAPLDRSIYQEVVTDFILKGRDPSQLGIPLLRALINGDWKFVSSAFDEKIQPELYNLAEDPAEVRNRYTEQRDSELVKGLTRELEAIEHTRPSISSAIERRAPVGAVA
jgi:arylsulfatase A-like enzyme